MHGTIVIVTVVTVYVAKETNIYIDAWTQVSEFNINGTQVKEVYRVKGAIAHRG